MKTSGNPVYVDKNWKIYNIILTFKEVVPKNKKMADFFKINLCAKKKNVTDTIY